MTTPEVYRYDPTDPPRWYTLIQTRADGGININGSNGEFETAEEERVALEEKGRTQTKPGQHYEVVGMHDFLRDKRALGNFYFHNALQWQPGSSSRQASGLVPNMPYCRAIFRHHIREERDPLLNALDVEFYRALEAGEDTADIAAQKQVLRDLPQDPAIEAAQTPQELFDAWPEDSLGAFDPIHKTQGRGRPGRGYYESPGTY